MNIPKIREMLPFSNKEKIIRAFYFLRTELLFLVAELQTVQNSAARLLTKTQTLPINPYCPNGPSNPLG